MTTSTSCTTDFSPSTYAQSFPLSPVRAGLNIRKRMCMTGNTTLTVQAKVAGLHRLYEEKARLVRASWEMDGSGGGRNREAGARERGS